MTHLQYVTSAYLIAALVVILLIVRIAFDYRGQKRKLADLEARGVRRRSGQS